MIRGKEDARIPVEIFALRHALRKIDEAKVRRCVVEVWMPGSREAAFFKGGPIKGPLAESIKLGVHNQLDIQCFSISKGDSTDKDRMKKSENKLKDHRSTSRSSSSKPKSTSQQEKKVSSNGSSSGSALKAASSSNSKNGSSGSSRDAKATTNDAPPRKSDAKTPSAAATSKKPSPAPPTEYLQVFLAAVLPRPQMGTEALGEVILLGDSEGEEEGSIGLAAAFLVVPSAGGAAVASPRAHLRPFSMNVPQRKLPTGLPPALLSLAEALEQVEDAAPKDTRLRAFVSDHALPQFWVKDLKGGAVTRLKAGDKHPANRSLKTLHNRRFHLTVEVAKEATPEWNKLLETERLAKKALGL